MDPISLTPPTPPTSPPNPTSEVTPTPTPTPEAAPVSSTIEGLAEVLYSDLQNIFTFRKEVLKKIVDQNVVEAAQIITGSSENKEELLQHLAAQVMNQTAQEGLTLAIDVRAKLRDTFQVVFTTMLALA